MLALRSTVSTSCGGSGVIRPNAEKAGAWLGLEALEARRLLSASLPTLLLPLESLAAPATTPPLGAISGSLWDDSDGDATWDRGEPALGRDGPVWTAATQTREVYSRSAVIWTNLEEVDQQQSQETGLWQASAASSSEYVPAVGSASQCSQIGEGWLAASGAASAQTDTLGPATIEAHTAVELQFTLATPTTFLFEGSLQASGSIGDPYGLWGGTGAASVELTSSGGTSLQLTGTDLRQWLRLDVGTWTLSLSASATLSVSNYDYLPPPPVIGASFDISMVVADNQARAVFLDLDANSRIGPQEPVAMADGSGQYLFSDLSAGTYAVRQVLPKGWGETSPGNLTQQSPQLATVANREVRNVDFGSMRVAEMVVERWADHVDGVHDYDFGQVPRGQTRSLELGIRNEGQAVLRISGAEGLTAPFEVLPANGVEPGDDWLIEPGQTLVISIEFDPSQWQGNGQQTLVLSSNDPLQSAYPINLAGVGLGEIRGTLWSDVNADGVRDAGDGALAATADAISPTAQVRGVSGDVEYNFPPQHHYPGESGSDSRSATALDFGPFQQTADASLTPWGWEAPLTAQSSQDSSVLAQGLQASGTAEVHLLPTSSPDYCHADATSTYTVSFELSESERFLLIADLAISSGAWQYPYGEPTSLATASLGLSGPGGLAAQMELNGLWEQEPQKTASISQWLTLEAGTWTLTAWVNVFSTSYAGVDDVASSFEVALLAVEKGAIPVYQDADADGQFDPAERVAYPDGDGCFALTELLPGDYQVGVISRPQWEQTSPLATRFVSVNNGQLVDGQDFGIHVPIPGDLNRDGVVNALDISGFVDCLVTYEYQAEGDFNEDGAVNALDINGFIGALTSLSGAVETASAAPSQKVAAVPEETEAATLLSLDTDSDAGQDETAAPVEFPSLVRLARSATDNPVVGSSSARAQRHGQPVSVAASANVAAGGWGQELAPGRRLSAFADSGEVDVLAMLG